MIKLKIKLLAYQGAPDFIFKNAIKRLEQLISHGEYELTKSNPDVLFFLSGGSEKSAINCISPGNFYLLIGSQHNNAYASASEVKAYLNKKDIPSLLIDEEDIETKSLIDDFIAVKQALKNIKGKRLGMIGQASDWLIASSIPSEILESKLGIDLISIPWNKLPHYTEFKASDEFLNFYSEKKVIDLSETAKVYALLDDIKLKWDLDAITVECFPLVQKDSVTACLSLAKFNSDGVPAGCEGDHTAIVGMMLCRELTGLVPWIANINKVSDEICMFSHCTIGINLISDYSLRTHYETGKGTAIEGSFKGDLVTIFRFDNNLSKAFISSAKITGRPKSGTACRTQIEVRLAENDVNLLKQYPLGNHHLIVPGNYTKIFQFACRILGIDIL